MTEELINQIVRRVLSEPAFQALLQEKVSENITPKPDGLVLLNYVPDLEQVLTAVKKRFAAEFTLNILPSEAVGKVKPELPAGMSWVTPLDALAKGDWQRLIIPACSLNTLAKAALGLRDNPISEMIGRGLTQGKPIELVTEYLGLTAQTPPMYLELYKGYIQKLKAYGVKVCATLEDVESIDDVKSIEDEGSTEDECCKADESSIDKSQVADNVPLAMVRQVTGFFEQRSIASDQQATSRKAIRYEKKYLADKDAYGFPEESIVLIKRLTVISPLARDTLKLRGIELRQETEGERR